MIDHFAIKFNEDIYQNIILDINNDKSLVNLYLTDRRFQKLLNNKHILRLLTVKFNIIAKIHNFTDFMNNFGNFIKLINRGVILYIMYVMKLIKLLLKTIR